MLDAMDIYTYPRADIEIELNYIQAVARMLRAGSHASLRSELTQLLTRHRTTRAPLMELFTWSENQAAKKPAYEYLRDTLYEVITLCARVNRYCVAVLAYPHLPIEPLNESGTADRLEFLADKLGQNFQERHPPR